LKPDKEMQFLIVWETTILFCIATSPFYITTNNVPGYNFSTSGQCLLFPIFWQWPS
jgi:hypothetical protein